MRKLSTIFLLLMLILLSGIYRTAAGQDPQPTPSDNEVNRVAKQMYCPVCENIPLDVCPTQACSEWRELIRLKLSEGWSDEQIKDYFAEQYGDRVLAEPPRKGLNWLVYIIPLLFIAGGTAVVLTVLTTMKRRTSPPGTTMIYGSGPVSPVAPGGLEDEHYLKELEEELQKDE